ncbi:hypothetical protein Tsubulata_047952 [Turnera subulata]|uniref:Uncharacterized protein n=1 Tax=Turnera subulata TaxID=218843 RepID=A0A9Q0JHU3_9ROSI|nr:hypothetical protein Tsubulata_047952 [Turnera subulata]
MKMGPVVLMPPVNAAGKDPNPTGYPQHALYRHGCAPSGVNPTISFPPSVDKRPLIKVNRAHHSINEQPGRQNFGIGCVLRADMIKWLNPSE